MHCEEFQKFAEAYVDDEFDGFEQAEIEAHLATCEDCRALAIRLKGFRAFLEQQVRNVRAPVRLQAAVASALDSAAAPARPALRRTTVVLASVAALALLVINLFPRPEPESMSSDLVTEPIIEASVDWHRRNLPVEVTGPDTDVIREWFMDKVDFPVRLPTFDDSLRSSVLGGRLNQLNNRSAAHVVYEVEGAKVSVTLFRARNLRVPNRDRRVPDGEYFLGNRQGYNVALFRDNGVTYAITTEMPQPHFDQFVNTVAFGE